MYSSFENPLSRIAHAGVNPESFQMNSNAELPKAASFGNVMSQMDFDDGLHVPQTAPDVSHSYSIVDEKPTDSESWNKMRFLKMNSPYGDWTDKDVYSPPDEMLAQTDLKKQEKKSKEIIDNLPAEKKQLLSDLEAGKLFTLSKLKEEN